MLIFDPPKIKLVFFNRKKKITHKKTTQSLLALYSDILDNALRHMV